MSKLKSSLLWSFTKQGKSSYLFGTMHVKDYRIHHFTDQVFPFIEKCDGFATEFHLEEFSTINMQGYDKLPDNKSLKDYMSTKKYQKMHRSIRKAFQIDIDPLSKVLPIFLINTISESILVNSEGMALDTILWQHASKLEASLYGLESVQDQFRILAAIPLDYQLKSLVDLSKNVSSFKSKILKMVSLYENQDIQQLYKYSKKSLGKQKKLMIYSRNVNMTKRIVELHHEVPQLFCAVGAAHLSGKFGLLRLLKEEGYAIDAIRLN